MNSVVVIANTNVEASVSASGDQLLDPSAEIDSKQLILESLNSVDPALLMR